MAETTAETPMTTPSVASNERIRFACSPRKAIWMILNANMGQVLAARTDSGSFLPSSNRAAPSTVL